MKSGANPNLRDVLDDALPLMGTIDFYKNSKTAKQKDDYKKMAVLLVENGAYVTKHTKDGEFSPKDFAKQVDEKLWKALNKALGLRNDRKKSELSESPSGSCQQTGEAVQLQGECKEKAAGIS